MARFSLKWLFVGVAGVALAITALVNANLWWVLAMQSVTFGLIGASLCIAVLAPRSRPLAIGFASFGLFQWFADQHTPFGLDWLYLVSESLDHQPSDQFWDVADWLRCILAGLLGACCIRVACDRRPSVYYWLIGMSGVIAFTATAAAYDSRWMTVVTTTMTYAVLASAVCVAVLNYTLRAFATSVAVFGTISYVVERNMLYESLGMIVISSLWARKIIWTNEELVDARRSMRGTGEVVQYSLESIEALSFAIACGVLVHLAYEWSKKRVAKP